MTLSNMAMIYRIHLRVDSLFDRKALQEYVLYAAQHHAGGLIDKPPKSVPSLIWLSTGD